MKGKTAFPQAAGQTAFPPRSCGGLIEGAEDMMQDAMLALFPPAFVRGPH